MRYVLCLALFAASLFGQDGLTITGSHPRILWTSARLAAAQADYAVHPWTLQGTSATIETASSYAAHSLITNTPGECTSAISAITAWSIWGLTDGGPHGYMQKFKLADPGGNAANQVRGFGEAVVDVYDWCYASMSSTDRQKIRDRWAGTTSGPGDPIHAPTDLASVAGSSTVTSTQNPFLPNMAQDNVIRFFGGGTHCPNEMYNIVSYIDANTVTVDGDPTSGGNASGCTARISGYVDATRQMNWGGLAMPWSNFFWGYIRNEILFAITFLTDSPYSTPFLDMALGSRWPVALKYFAGTSPYDTQSVKGGQHPESTDYGKHSMAYLLNPLIACKDFGRDLMAETNWFREAGAFMLYNSTLVATYEANLGSSYFQIFPMGDDQTQTGYPSAVSNVELTPLGYTKAHSVSNPLSDLALYFSQIYGSVNIGKYIRQWVQNINPLPTPWYQALDPGGATLALAGLPLDYYAPGSLAFFTKNSWSAAGTQVKTLASTGGPSEHIHANSGDFAIARNGVWLTKEWTAYSQVALCGGYTGQAESPTPVDTCEDKYGYAHNVITLDTGTSQGCQTSVVTANAPPFSGGVVQGYGSVIRLESQTNYSYEVMDVSSAYKAIPADTNHECRDHNPYVGTVQREFLFIKPLETLVILDRVLSDANYFSAPFNKHLIVTAANVIKRVQIHSPVAPTISGNTASWTNQGQKLKGWFFGPATISLANIDEGNFTGHRTEAGRYQQRLEFSNTADVTNGVAVPQSYMVSVLRAGDASGFQDFTTNTLVDNGSTLTLTLNHPSGNAVWVINKGSVSSGGTFGYAASGTPTQLALATGVSVPTVSDSGVTWPTVPVITAAPTSVSLSCTAGAPTGQTPSQIVAIGGSSVVLDNWSATKTQSWLSLSPTSSSAAGDLTVTGACAGLPAGTYTDTISVASTTATVTNSPMAVPVTLTVLPSTIDLDPTSVAVPCTIGGTHPSNSISVASTGATLTNWSAAGNEPWLSATPSTGTAPGTFALGVNCDSLTAGSYSGSVTISSTTPFLTTPSSVSVDLTVYAALAITTPNPMPSAFKNLPYAQTLTLTGGQSPFTWSVSSGSLPAGLSLVGNVISGTPTTIGTASFTLRVTDAGGAAATLSTSISVLSPPGGGVMGNPATAGGAIKQ